MGTPEITKALFYSLMTCTVWVLTGCSANSLVKNFRDRGITPASTAKLRFVGSKNDFGDDISVTIKDPRIIKVVWDSIYSATPAEPQEGHFGGIIFYTSEKAEWPAETLLVNPNDASFLDSEFSYQYDDGKMNRLMNCPGLYKLRMQHLEEEYNKRKGNL